MSYSIGDKIVYPMHGAGVIVDKVNRKIMDEIRCYYVVKSPISEMVAMLPVDNMDGIGIRDVITDSEADELLDEIKTMDTEETSNWNKRYRENMEKLKDGSIYEIAQIAKSLMTRDKSLSTGERKLMINAKNAVLSEIMLAKNISLIQAEDALKKSIYCDSDVEEE
ncbi:MAG TPA: CarD family transcriptional regulator [Clostridia bacterium]|nr:CarD family transcriptional regulator [Clostridia bacterium]HOM34219.1 CarD family transcriptional regulator [Clostridia bacterium]HOR89734.1 CarD family transcriptional regulator [Clostridia bacterium]HOT71454.1 CarD family transcriptional regulator [Clostridia bacterium]HPL08026.1 CarD family transcriptional regulator [Clostridia bacterium]